MGYVLSGSTDGYGEYTNSGNYYTGVLNEFCNRLTLGLRPRPLLEGQLVLLMASSMISEYSACRAQSAVDHDDSTGQGFRKSNLG